MYIQVCKTKEKNIYIGEKDNRKEYIYRGKKRGSKKNTKKKEKEGEKKEKEAKKI